MITGEGLAMSQLIVVDKGLLIGLSKSRKGQKNYVS